MSRRRQQTAFVEGAGIPVPDGGTQDASGVGRRAREDGSTRNWRDPPRQPSSGKGGSHKPKAKGNRAGRESEGLVVPLTTGTKTPSEGRGPAWIASADEGACEGMAGSQPKFPREKVRRLQRRLFVSAKTDGKRRFHALYDRIFRSDVLGEAWDRVRKNKGAAGVDGETLSMIERRGVPGFLEEIQERLRTGRYRPQPVWRRYIPTRGGQRRSLPGGKPFRYVDWPHTRFVAEHGLYKLLGTIRYPDRTHAA